MMKTSSVFVPVLFIVILFVIVLPRLSRSQSASVQVLPHTSITPAAMQKPRVVVRPASASRSTSESNPVGVGRSVAVEVAEPTDFSAPYLNGHTDEVVAVSVEDLFSLRVVQQPQGQAEFVSLEQNVLTQFGLPSQYGATGLLAHNYLSGELFSDIQAGDYVRVVLGDGRTELYQVNRIESYQALTPNSPYSQFVNLNTPHGEVLTSASLFNRIYTTPGQLIFQTCIAAEGESSWGRLFIIANRSTFSSAIPIPEQFIYNN